MIRKIIKPIISKNGAVCQVVGTHVEYRLFSLLVYQKMIFTSEKYGIENVHRF